MNALGVLITYVWVLTAAHCNKWYVHSVPSPCSITLVISENRFAHSTFVYAGSNSRGKGYMRKVSKWIIHEVYKEPSKIASNSEHHSWISANHDIALVKVQTPFPRHVNDGQSYSLNTICLPGSDKIMNRYEENATLFGFGLIESGGDFWETTHDKLLKANVVLKPSKYCREMYCTEFKNDNDPRPCPVS